MSLPKLSLFEKIGSNIYYLCADIYNCFYLDNNVGDLCQDDFDGDEVPNYLDNCPNNSKIFSTDFR